MPSDEEAALLNSLKDWMKADGRQGWTDLQLCKKACIGPETRPSSCTATALALQATSKARQCCIATVVHLRFLVGHAMTVTAAWSENSCICHSPKSTHTAQLAQLLLPPLPRQPQGEQQLGVVTVQSQAHPCLCCPANPPDAGYQKLARQQEHCQPCASSLHKTDKQPS